MIGKYGDIYGNQDPAKDIYVYVVSHPVLLYRMIRRYAEDLNPILMQVATQNPQLLGLLQEVTDATIPKSVVLPDSEDLFFALDALRRIQQGHLLDTYEVIEKLNLKIGYDLSFLDDNKCFGLLTVRARKSWEHQNQSENDRNELFRVWCLPP